MTNTEQFYGELSSILKKYQGERDNLSRETGVSPTTIWRWSTGINKMLPEPYKVVKLLSKDSGLKKISSIADYYKGEIYKFLVENFPSQFKDGYYDEISNNDTFMIKDFYSYIIYTLISNKRGATDEEIIQVIGNLSARKSGLDLEDITEEVVRGHGIIALVKVKELIENNMIFQEADGSYSPTTMPVQFDLNDVVAFFPEMVQGFLKSEEFDKGLNGVFYVANSIPKKVANEIAIETKEFYLKMYKKMRDNASADGVPYFIFNLAETLWFNNIKESEERKIQ